MTPQESGMSPNEKHDYTTQQRMLRMRSRRAEAGLPAQDRVRRALVTAAQALPVDVRQSLLESMLISVDASEQEGFRKVAADLLGVTTRK